MLPFLEFLAGSESATVADMKTGCQQEKQRLIHVLMVLGIALTYGS
jgi:hypothetical protein